MELVRSVVTNPLFVQYVLKPCFLSLITIMTRILYLKTSEEEQEQQADQIIDFSKKFMESYKHIAKANSEAQKTIVNVYDSITKSKTAIKRSCLRLCRSVSTSIVTGNRNKIK